MTCRRVTVEAADAPADDGGGGVIAFSPVLEGLGRETLRNCLQNWCSTLICAAEPRPHLGDQSGAIVGGVRRIRCENERRSAGERINLT